MTLIDEEIARMLHKKKREETIQKQQEPEEEIPDETELAEMLRQGEIQIGKKKVPFQVAWILEGRIGIFLPAVSSEVKANTPVIYQMLDNTLGISFQFYLSEEKKENFESLSVYKERMTKNMKPSGVVFQWLEEGSFLIQGNSACYLEFTNPTGMGIIHNFMLFVQTEYGQLICNFNYEDRERAFWKPVLKMLVKQIEMKRENERKDMDERIKETDGDV